MQRPHRQPSMPLRLKLKRVIVGSQPKVRLGCWERDAGRIADWWVDFTKCLEATNGDMGSCGYYLEALSK